MAPHLPAVPFDHVLVVLVEGDPPARPQTGDNAAHLDKESRNQNCSEDFRTHACNDAWTLWLVMRQEAVSALRERGLPRVCGTGLQHCEPEFKQPLERKTDTMKSYILLQPEPVQSQITIAPAGSKSSILFVGLDVHNDSIAVSLAPSDSELRGDSGIAL